MRPRTSYPFGRRVRSALSSYSTSVSPNVTELHLLKQNFRKPRDSFCARPRIERLRTYTLGAQRRSGGLIPAYGVFSLPALMDDCLSRRGGVKLHQQCSQSGTAASMRRTTRTNDRQRAQETTRAASRISLSSSCTRSSCRRLARTLADRRSVELILISVEELVLSRRYQLQ